MRNVTISLDEDTAQWARVEAAKAGKSLSRWIGEKLETEQRVPSAPKGFLNGIGRHLEVSVADRSDRGAPEHFDRSSLRKSTVSAQ